MSKIIASEIQAQVQELVLYLARRDFDSYLPFQTVKAGPSKGQVKVIGQGKRATHICVVCSLDSLELGKAFGEAVATRFAAHGYELRLYLYPERELTPREQDEFFGKLVRDNAASLPEGQSPVYHLVITNAAPILKQAVKVRILREDAIYRSGAGTLSAWDEELFGLLGQLDNSSEYVELLSEHAKANLESDELTKFSEQLASSSNQYIEIKRYLKSKKQSKASYLN